MEYKSNHGKDVALIKNIDQLGDSIPTAGSNPHIRFCCPFCEQRRGKPDKDYKLYFNTKKQSGFCFKCGISVFYDDLELKTDETKLVKKILDNLYVEEKEIVDTRFDISWAQKIANDDKFYNYIASTRKFDPDVISKYNMRSGSIVGKEFVLIPDRVISGNVVNSFQLRFLNAPKKRRHYTTPGTKPLVFLDKIVNTDTIILSEGYFDAIRLGENALGLMGVYLTDHQLSALFSEYPMINNFIIALDGGEDLNALKICYKLKEVYDSKFYIAFFPTDVDPDEAGGLKGATKIDRIFV